MIFKFLALMGALLIPSLSLADVEVRIVPSGEMGTDSSFDGFYNEYQSGSDYDGGFVDGLVSNRSYIRVRNYQDDSNIRHHLILLKYDLSAVEIDPEDVIGAYLAVTTRVDESAGRTGGVRTMAVGVYTGNDDDITRALRYDAANPLIDDAYPAGGDGDPDVDFAEGAVQKLLDYSNNPPMAGEVNRELIGLNDVGFAQAVKDALTQEDQAITFLFYAEGEMGEYYAYGTEQEQLTPDNLDKLGPILTLETIPEPFLSVDPGVAFAGEELALTWYAPPGATNVMITPDLGDVSGDMDEFGRGSRTITAPETNTTYTLSYDFEGSSPTFMDDVVVESSLFESVVITNNISEYEQASNFMINDPAFTDRDYIWTELPDMVMGGQAIRFGMGDRENDDLSAALTAAADSTLFLMIDNRVGDPFNLVGTDTPTIGGGVMDWVVEAGFIDTGIDANVLVGTTNTPCSVFFVQVAAGETVTLLNQSDGDTRLMYTPVLVTPRAMATGFSAFPNVVLDYSPINLSWAVPPGSTNLSISPDVGDVTAETDAVTGVGGTQVIADGQGSYEYTLSYEPPGGGTVDISIDMTVEELVFDFSILPESQRVGDPITLSWQIPPGSTGVVISDDNDDYADVGDVTSQTDETTGVGTVTVGAPGADTLFSIDFTFDGNPDFLDADFFSVEEPAVFASVVATGNSKAVDVNPEPLADGTTIFNDRAFVFVDVPPLLEGAELVRFGNDDKNNGSISVDVTVSSDTTLFLMIDNRVGDGTTGADNPPTLGGGVMDWVLAAGFVDTGLDVTDDEGTPTLFSIFFLQAGAGETVNFAPQADGNSRLLYSIAGVSPQVSPPTPFLATPNVVNQGESVALQWTVPVGSTVAIDQGVGDVTDQTDAGTGIGSVDDMPETPGTLIYTLSYTEGEGEEATTTALRSYVTVVDTGGPTPAPPISSISIDPATGEVSFSWTAPDGVTDPGDLTDSVERSVNLAGGWDPVPGGIFTISEGVITFRDPSPPAGKAFYRVNRP